VYLEGCLTLFMKFHLLIKKKKVCENVYDVVLICVQLFLVCFGHKGFNVADILVELRFC